MDKISIFWFRKDLRIEDNCGFYHALKSGNKVLPIFIFDPEILNLFEKPHNRQVEFIYEQILCLKREFNKLGSSIILRYSSPLDFFKDLIDNKKYNIKAVYTNEDYELSSINRDKQIRDFLSENSISLHTYKDDVIYAKDDIVKADGKPYTVFTPYSKKWKERFSSDSIQRYDSENHLQNLFPLDNQDSLPSIEDLGFTRLNQAFPSKDIDEVLLKNYAQKRDFPYDDETSHLGVHLRFGTISVRELVLKAHQFSETFLNELIWREFYKSIIWHFPHVCSGEAFNRKYDKITWINNEYHFRAWCEGKTGYPIVDAGMRQLNATGFMHNRVRMITASFLIKHLLVDWRWGEAYFANKLIDFDFSSNNGGWQWCAGSGCDAAPYFRVFNPELQTQKFDKELRYIKKWVPEYGTNNCPKPIIDHQFARNRVIETYKKALVE